MRPAILGGEEVKDCEEEDVTEKLPLSAVYTGNLVNFEKQQKNQVQVNAKTHFLFDRRTWTGIHDNSEIHTRRPLSACASCLARFPNDPLGSITYGPTTLTVQVICRVCLMLRMSKSLSHALEKKATEIRHKRRHRSCGVPTCHA